MRGNRKHGEYRTKRWRAWTNIKDRCTNANHPRYKDYGARGITIAPQWMTYEGFSVDVPEPEEDAMSIGRIDNSGNYEPGNVRWETVEQQQNNRRNNVILEYDGRKLTMAQWAREMGFKYVTLKHRMRAGWTIEEALTTPVGERV